MSEWFKPYTAAELDRAQEIYGLIFPPDLVELMSRRHKLLHYDWRTDNTAIREMVRRPYEGLLFDVEHSRVWLPQWGERPETPGERAETLEALVAAAPKLIPLCSHRYLPQEPAASGNPVFSIVQADMIYYGANLADYFDRELNPAATREKPWPDIRRIRFWSDFVDGPVYGDN